MSTAKRNSDAPQDVSPCEGCGEPLGGRYGDPPACWPCSRSGIDPLPADPPRRDPEWVKFRARIIDSLAAFDPERYFHLDSDTILTACPLCVSGYLNVHFHGRAPRADIVCSLGCREADIGAWIKGRAAR
jgi:hypothetical protein